MNPFKQQRVSPHSILEGFLLLLMIFAAGCNVDETTTPGDQASFYAETFKGESLITSQADNNPLASHWGIVQEVRYNYSLCLKDYTYQEPVTDHSFVIKQKNWKAEAVTDSQGCLHWKKDYTFDFLADPHYIEENFQIKAANGLHQGQMQARAAINPWTPVRGLKELEFVDLSKNSVPYLVPNENAVMAMTGEFERPGSSEHAPALWMDGLRVLLRDSYPQKQKLELDVELTGKPFITLRNTTGQTYSHPLNRGKFLMKVFLVGNTKKNGKRHRSILNVMTKENLSEVHSAQVENELLHSEFQISVADYPHDGQLELYIKLIPDPATAPPDIGTYRAYYVLGDARHFSQSYRAKLKTDKKELAEIEKLLESQVGDDELLGHVGDENQEDSTKSDSKRRLDKYFFRPLTVKYGGIVRQEETATARTVKILVTACILDPLLFRPVRHRRFEVQIKPASKAHHFQPSTQEVVTRQEEVLELTTDQDGCLRFEDRLRHKWYYPEQFFVKPYKITDIENRDPENPADHTGVSSTLEAVINPWNTGWLFARDKREVKPESLDERSKESPRLFMSHYRMQARGTGYSVDDWLRLTVKKKYDFVIKPRVIRHDSLTTGLFGQHPLRDGLYLVRLALVKNFNSEGFRPDLYVDSWEKVVRVRGGTVAVPMDFDLQDLTLVGSRNRLLVEMFTIHSDKVVYTDETQNLTFDERVIDQKKTLAKENLIDKYSGLSLPTFAGPFIPIYEGQGPTLLEVDTPATKVIEAGEQVIRDKERAFAKKHQPKNFDRRFRLKFLDLDENEDRSYLTKSSRLTEGDLEELVQELLFEGPERPGLRTQLGRKLCSLWANRFMPEMLERYAEVDKKLGRKVEPIPEEHKVVLYSEILRHCQQTQVRGEAFFKFDKKLLVHDIDQDSLTYMGGESFNFNVGSGFSLSKNEGWNIRQGHSSDASLSVDIGPDTPIISLGASRSESWSSSESQAYDIRQGASINYGTGAYLVIQHSNFRFHITDYDRCLIIKPRWKIMEAFMNSPLPKDMRKKDSWNWWPFMETPEMQEDRKAETMARLITNERYLDVMESGLRLCTTPKDPYPIQALEDYYYVTQHFTTGDMHDPTDLRNRPWLLEIRSRRDFRVFLESIHQHNKMSHVGELPYTPIDILSESYAHYANQLPSWPRFYTFYNYDPYQAENCDSTQSMAQNFLDSAKEVLAGPLKNKDGKDIMFGTDFWQVFYCPQAEQ